MELRSHKPRGMAKKKVNCKNHESQYMYTWNYEERKMSFKKSQSSTQTLKKKEKGRVQRKQKRKEDAK